MAVPNKKNYPRNDQIVIKSTIGMFNLFLFDMEKSLYDLKLFKVCFEKICCGITKMALPMKHLLSLKHLQFFRPIQTVRNMITRDLFLEKHFRVVEMLHEAYTLLTYLFSNIDDNRVV